MTIISSTIGTQPMRVESFIQAFFKSPSKTWYCRF